MCMVFQLATFLLTFIWNISTELQKMPLKALEQTRPNELAIERVGKSIGMLSSVLHQFDQEHGLKPISGAHHRANLQKDLGIIVAELMKVDNFSIQADGKYPTFQSPRDLLHVKSDSDVRDWMVSRLETLKNQR